jgi:crossover junction endodeoxyribonuclease RuvC
MTKKRISLGLDLSLVNSGVAVLKNGKIIETQSIKSKPVGDRPIDELIRIRKIVSQIQKIVDTHHPEIVVIENMAFMARNTTSLTQLAGLNYFIRAMVTDYDIPFYLVAPTSLKRYATGHGKSEKDHMILSAYKEFGIEDIDNNIADAIFLAQIGSKLIGEKITLQYQIETVDLLKKQK